MSWTPPPFGDRYHLYAQFHPTGGSPQTFLAPLAVAGATVRTPLPVYADGVDVKQDGNNLLYLDRPATGFRPGAQTVQFMVHDATSRW